MRVSGIWKSRLSALFVTAIMILAISGCTIQGNDSSCSAPDAVHQIEDSGTAILDDNPIAEEPQLDVDELNGFSDDANVQGEIISAEPYEGKNSAAESNHALEGVEEHELTEKDVTEIFFEDECESYSFADVESGQYAVGDIIYTVGEDKSSFEYAINWEPMGNYIRVGLINADMNDSYFVSCISGRGKGDIDITEIPSGDYYVFVYNETSSEISLNGTVAYNFK